MQEIDTKSKLANHFLDRLKNDKRINIVEIHKGAIGLKKVKKMFFKEDIEAANKWAKTWSSYNKSQSIFVVYTYKKRVNMDMHFKFVIGDMESGSVLGEKYNYEIGLEKLSQL